MSSKEQKFIIVFVSIHDFTFVQCVMKGEGAMAMIFSRASLVAQASERKFSSLLGYGKVVRIRTQGKSLLGKVKFLG